MSTSPRGLIILDRDGVLNELFVDPEQGTIDSPLVPSQVVIPNGVPEALKALHDMGYLLSIATNQPAAAKGKTTIENLTKVHEVILTGIKKAGAEIKSSHICFHRREDNCACRKPKPGMLLEALEIAGDVPLDHSWMVGDGINDMEAGRAAGLKTAFLGLPHCSACKYMENFQPDMRFDLLTSFVRFLSA